MRLFPVFTAILLAATYSGTAAAQRTWHPTITANSPSELRHGESITVNGTDLAPWGWRRVMRFRGKYSQGSAVHQLNSGGSTQFTITADREMRGDSVWIEWVVDVDSIARKNPIPESERIRYLPNTFVVHAAPDLTFGGEVVTPDIGPRFNLMTVENGLGVVKGKWLRDVRFSGSFADVQLRGLSITYEPNGSTISAGACCQGGADRAVFIPPSQQTTGWLMIEHAFGRDSLAVTLAFPPAPAQVVMQTAAGIAPLSPSNTLVRGKTYVIRGQHLSITHSLSGTTSIKRGTPLLGGTPIAPIFASDTNIVFTVPATYTGTSATLGVTTPRGSASLGTFAVANPSVPINVTGISTRSKTGVETTILTAGKPIELVAALDIPLSSKEHEWGSLIVTQTGGPPGAVKIPARSIPVTGPATEFKIAGGDVQSSTPVTIMVAHESNGVNGQVTQTQQRTFTLRPPHPVKIEGPTSVTSGTTQEFTVRFDSATTTSSTMFVLLSSTNPNVAASPASATLSGDRATFTATIPPAFQPGGTATLSATLDGATATLPLTVQQPVIQQFTLYETRSSTVATAALPNAVVRADARFTGRLVNSANVIIESGDTTLARVNSDQNGPSQDGLTYTQFFVVSSGLSQPRSATITGRYGSSSRTVSVSLTPIVISTFTATPSSGTGGSTITATAIFSSAPTGLMYMTVASADTMRATVSPAGTSVQTGTASRVVSILLKGPVTVSRQVPITVTLRAGGPSGTIVSTQTTVVTVNP